jgi:hypothetical protein
VLVLEGHGGPVRSVAFAPDGRSVASTSGGSFLQVNEIRIWQAAAAPAGRTERP